MAFKIILIILLTSILLLTIGTLIKLLTISKIKRVCKRLGLVVTSVEPLTYSNNGGLPHVTINKTDITVLHQKGGRVLSLDVKELVAYLGGIN